MTSGHAVGTAIRWSGLPVCGAPALIGRAVLRLEWTRLRSGRGLTGLPGVRRGGATIYCGGLAVPAGSFAFLAYFPTTCGGVVHGGPHIDLVGRGAAVALAAVRGALLPAIPHSVTDGPVALLGASVAGVGLAVTVSGSVVAVLAQLVSVIGMVVPLFGLIVALLPGLPTPEVMVRCHVLRFQHRLVRALVHQTGLSLVGSAGTPREPGDWGRDMGEEGVRLLSRRRPCGVATRRVRIPADIRPGAVHWPRPHAAHIARRVPARGWPRSERSCGSRRRRGVHGSCPWGPDRDASSREVASRHARRSLQAPITAWSSAQPGRLRTA
jgi:hypothetical protein